MLRSRPARLVALALAGVLALAACSGEPEPQVGAAVETTDPDAVLTAIAGPSAHEAALETSRALFDAAPLVVLAPAGDAAAHALGGRAAIALGVPLLVAPPEPAASA
ncbi:hypothetical protein NWP09_11570, partial [Agrococcus sp. HG114]|nr:hypothetical protein [Agrococcus sp. HG114]